VANSATTDTAVVSAHDDPRTDPAWVSTAFRRRKPAETAFRLDLIPSDFDAERDIEGNEFDLIAG